MVVKVGEKVKKLEDEYREIRFVELVRQRFLDPPLPFNEQAITITKITMLQMHRTV